MSPTRKQFSRIAIVFLLTLGLVCLSIVMIPFKSDSEERQGRDAIVSHQPTVSTTANVLAASSPGVTQQVKASGPLGSANSRVYVDPKTGEIGTPPPGTQLALPLAPEEKNALNSSSEGLVQVPSPVPGGGVMVDLQGRFRVQTVATIDAQSNLSIRSVPSGVGGNKTTNTEK